MKMKKQRPGLEGAKGVANGSIVLHSTVPESTVSIHDRLPPRAAANGVVEHSNHAVSGAARLPESRRMTVASLIEPLLRIGDLARRLACDRRTVDRMRSSGCLPKADLLVGRRSPRWKKSTIEDWIDAGGKLP
jgi:predicted DNA-binding transcriptional regulator AlpA